MTKKIITSFGFGDHSELLEIALPSMYKYAYTFDYDVFTPSQKNLFEIGKTFNWDLNRPASWLKVPLIKHLLLSEYDTVLWLDSDVVVNRFDEDINANFDLSDAIQAFVVHMDLYEGQVPNCGVWLLKKTAINLLDDIWNNPGFINHKWWEQGSNIDIISKNRELISKCYPLEYKFNVHKNDIRYNEQEDNNGAILHATMWQNRVERMKYWSSRIDK